MDVYEIVTEKIVAMLERGTIPWRKSWSAGSGMPKNLISQKEYRGINIFILSAMPFSSAYWLTYKQATDLGGHVRKGEKSTPVIFWKMLDRQNQNQDNDTKEKKSRKNSQGVQRLTKHPVRWQPCLLQALR